MNKAIEVKNKIKQNKINIIIGFVYVLITLIITFIFHEKWRDEAQAWMLARDLNFIDLIKQMSYEGHPPLWHIILMPFAKMRFPYITENLISCIFMWISMILILTKSPFKKTTQILILASLPFIYLYPTVARSYCLIPLAIILIAIYYPNRNEKSIQYVLSILFLAYTHVLMLGLVGILYLFFFLEQIFYIKKDKKAIKRLIVNLCIAIVGLLLLALMLYGSIGKNDDVRTSSIFLISRAKISNLSNNIGRGLFGVVAMSNGFRIVFSAFCIIFILAQAKINPQNLIIALVTMGWQAYIYLCIYGISDLKINTIMILFILIGWLNLNELNNFKLNKKNVLEMLTKIGVFLLILSDIQGITMMSLDVKGQYSGSKLTAKYIENNLEENAIIIGEDGPITSAVIPYTKNKKFWNPSPQQYFTYMTWDKISKEVLPIKQIIENVKNNFTSDDNVYLLVVNQIDDASKLIQIKDLQKDDILTEELYRSENKSVLEEEMYSIYKINL